MAVVDYHGMNDKNFMGTQVLFSMKTYYTKNGKKGWIDDEKIYPVGYAMVAILEKDEEYNESRLSEPIVIMKIGDGEHKFAELPILNGELTPMGELSFSISDLDDVDENNNKTGNKIIQFTNGTGSVNVKIPGILSGESSNGHYTIYSGEGDNKVELLSIPATVAVLNNDIKNFIKNQMITIQDTTLVINTNLL